MNEHLVPTAAGFTIAGIGYVFNSINEAFPWLLSDTGAGLGQPFEAISSLTFTGAALFGCFHLFKALMAEKELSAAAAEAATKAAAALAVAHAEERLRDAERHALERREEAARHADALAELVAVQSEQNKAEHAAAEVSRAEMNLRLKAISEKLEPPKR